MFEFIKSVASEFLCAMSVILYDEQNNVYLHVYLETNLGVPLIIFALAFFEGIFNGKYGFSFAVV